MKSYRLKPELTSAVLLAVTFISACRGPEGPGGISPIGVDVLPPTLEMTSPWPLDFYWDRLTFKAAAVDNVDIDRVVFTLDGSPAFASIPMIVTRPPYQFTIPLASIRPGFHLAGARAYDKAGNIIDAAPRTVWLGQSRLLSDTTVVYRYNNGIRALSLSAPDTARTSQFWFRFTPAKRGLLKNVTFTIGGTFSDTSEIATTLWEGEYFPEDSVTTVTVPAPIVAGEPAPYEFTIPEAKGTLDREFFLTVYMTKGYSGDTLRIGVDNGSPPHNRSGVKNDDGWQTLSRRYGLIGNLLVECQFYYDAVPVDTAGG